MVQICKETYYFTHFILFVGYLQVLCYVTDLFKFCKNIKMKMFRPIIIHFIHFIFQQSFSICKGLHYKLLLWVPITVSTKLCQQKKNIINPYREAYDTQNYLIMELSDTGYMLLFECWLSCFYIAWVYLPKIHAHSVKSGGTITEQGLAGSDQVTVNTALKRNSCSFSMTSVKTSKAASYN